MTTHYNCRNNVYPGTEGLVKRFPVPDDKVLWTVSYDGYDPPSYTSLSVLNKGWADPEIGAPGFDPTNEWNSDKGNVNRKCGSHKYEIDKDGYPINPVGRTGLKGRGLLGRWGSNAAGDAVVTRWKKDPATSQPLKNEATGKLVLEFVAINRKDCGEWAIPGGFCERKEDFFDTVKREFFEEAVSGAKFEGQTKDGTNVDNCLPPEYMSFAYKRFDDIFKKGQVVYSGYVDDIRNTDQAWISTTVVNFHDDVGNVFYDIKFKAGDDAGDVKWMDVNESLVLYANHKDFLRQTAIKLGAHF